MTADTPTGGTAGRLTLAGVVTIRTIDAIHAQLATLLQEHDHVDVDCGAITETDLNFVQLLVSARKSAGMMHQTLALTGLPSPPLHDALLRSGLIDTQAEQPGEDSAFWRNGIAGS